MWMTMMMTPGRRVIRPTSEMMRCPDQRMTTASTPLTKKSISVLGISRGDHPFQSKSHILNCQKETAVCAFARTKQCRWYATDMLVTYWLKAHHVLSRCPTFGFAIKVSGS